MTRVGHLHFLMAGLLAVLVLGSAVSVVYARHDARKLFIELQQLTAQRDALNIDWGRLQIEHSTWASPGRVEQIARDRLGMREPDPARVVIVEP
ncbi:MAG: cell division protein FtsL [Deltaproteobacteria bacterium]|jgi:cell division protein FtsL|nr:cell division protein FtsL [Deltaproteobacteria bacterium]